ncbi:MAG: hypothetical protein AB8V23_04815 [Candidatus Midichloria sp.]|uniref:Uncharacterized protein n=1 Tax=Hyalomma marginatum TaxID=34627 RepID=A0A8S4C118_9ACAR|nr:hypothetical protein MHYMCMPASI_00572 [Hyalomma marginatum]CAG7596445.1 hypothetical protein MHYMCMPSP_00992 [Hyalomma marginatum]
MTIPAESEKGKIKLAEMLGFHPLGLSQELAHIYYTKGSIDTYLKSYKRINHKVGFGGYSKSIKVNIELAINELKAKGDLTSLLAVKLS